MKRIISILLAFTLLTGCITVHASTVPILKLEANEYNSNGERHIKVSWEGTSGTYQIQLDDDVNFESPIEKKRSSKQGTYWNFVLSENVDATYYIRVRLSNGEWSNTVVADIDEQNETEDTPYFSIPELPKVPDISGSITVPDIDWSKYIKIDISNIDWSKVLK